jgi:sterol desaturase/sphingolipid hydroxylase (fatty acid hydroxylase superfamily)
MDSPAPDMPGLALLGIGVVFGAAFLEGVILHFRSERGFNWRSFACSMIDAVTRAWFTGAIVALNLAVFALAWAEENRIFHFSLDSTSAFIGLFFAEELCYYWYHRCSHRVRWLWASHKPHHTPNEIALGNAYRFGFTSILTGSRFFYIPAVLVGFPSEAVFGMLGLNLGYQFWIHNQWMPKLGWLEYVFNTASHHRVHHASNVQYLDANYGGILIIFDRMFGTFVEERDDVPCKYGLVEPLESNNPIVTSFHEWWRIGRDMIQAPSVRIALLYLVKPPGWRPDGTGCTTEELRRAVETC